MLRTATTHESNGDNGAPAPWHHRGQEAALGLDACALHATETLQNHIRRCNRRKQFVQPARASANNALYHEKHGDM